MCFKNDLKKHVKKESFSDRLIFNCFDLGSVLDINTNYLI